MIRFTSAQLTRRLRSAAVMAMALMKYLSVAWSLSTAIAAKTRLRPRSESLGERSLPSFYHTSQELRDELQQLGGSCPEMMLRSRVFPCHTRCYPDACVVAAGRGGRRLRWPLAGPSSWMWLALRGMARQRTRRQEMECKQPHSLAVQDVLACYNVKLEEGLSSSQVLQQRIAFGLNKLAEEEKKPLWKLIVAQFEDLLVRILLLSAVVSFILAYLDGSAEEGITAYVEPLVILLILIANAIVGVWQETNAEKALVALKRLQPDSALVLREGRWQQLNAEDLVPGDLVQVKVGDKVPADMRMVALQSSIIRVEQSQLTGESQSVSKELAPQEEQSVIQAKVNMLFASTTISNGSCVAVVTSTGMATEIGAIQDAVQSAADDEEQTPLQQKLDDFGNLLAKVIFAICALVWAINYKHFFDPIHGSVIRGCIYYFKIAVALAVAAIPEGLPAVITTCLALGTSEMAKKNAIVRKLPSVETLGCTTIICSDKTGTLTTNEMCCTKLVLPSSSTTQGNKLEAYTVEGHTYTPLGLVNGLCLDEWHQQLQFLAKILVNCNHARLEVDDANNFRRIGEPTET
eukprot:symbB.v1.2.004879.t2/scaffold264.1/size247971/20